MFHILAAQEQHQADTDSDGDCFSAVDLSIGGVNVDVVVHENKLLMAQIKDLSVINKSLNEEIRRLRGELNSLSSSGPSTTPPAQARRSSQAQKSKPKSIVSISDIMTPSDVLVAGLLYAGFEPSRLQRNNNERKIKWFKSFYGVAPTTVVPYFQDVKDMYPSINYKDCLMTMNWLFLYESYPVLTARWKYCEEYIGDKVIEYGMKMAKVGMKKITFNLKQHVKLGRTIDCCTFMCFEMRQDPSTEWFDYKTHSCGLKYQFCLATREPKVCHISGPHIPSKHDITVFRGGDADEKEEDRDQSALYFKVEDDERLIGDAGYSGEPTKVVTTKDEHSSELKEFLARAKNRQETFHTRLKSFNILGQRFRHGVNTKDRMRLHKMAVELVASIVQYDYENGHPPFDIC